jgi:C-terminal processing protease CtpA/Prc
MVSFGLLLVPLSAEVPEQLLRELGAPDFLTRERAQHELTAWAREQPNTVTDALLRVVKRHPVAEIRVRSLSVLRALVDELYDAEGQGYLGIRMRDDVATLPGAGEENVPVVLVSDVLPDSAAQKGGVQPGDRIVCIHQEDWGTPSPGRTACTVFQERIKSRKPKDPVRLRVLRQGAMIDLTVRLTRRPAALENPYAEPSQEEIQVVEQRHREEHFKKWLLEHKDEP